MSYESEEIVEILMEGSQWFLQDHRTAPHTDKKSCNTKLLADFLKSEYLFQLNKHRTSCHVYPIVNTVRNPNNYQTLL